MCSLVQAALVTVTALLMLASPSYGGGSLTIASVEPSRHALAVAPGSSIAVHFDRVVEPSSFTATPFRFHVIGERTGPTTGIRTFENGGATLRFTPATPFARGERVTVVLSRDVAGADASTLADGFAWQFWVAAAEATMEFTVLDVLDTSTPEVSPRPYGGSGCDVNQDGFPDLLIVNEDSSDVRVFLNRADGTGLYDDFLEPTNPVNAVPSPNETADFNGDGLVDFCTANVGGASISVLLGNGDGTFAPRQDYAVGSAPHGLAVLDADGDGDIDVATANTGGNNVSLLLNDGAGAFGPATFFEGGGSGEWALNAADMNNDGVFDLVVGAQGSGRLIIHLGNGDGTFTQAGSQTSGMAYWMIVCADVDGDGMMDVTSANGGSGNGAIHKGNGAGGVAAPSSAIFFGGGMVATDTGDLDGDGDLDWVLSNFGTGEYHVLTNDGAGNFTFVENLLAPSNSSCSILLDFDGDGDLDLALIDEISDEIVLRENSSTPPPNPDLDGNGFVGFADLTTLLAAWGPCPPPPAACPADLDGNGAVGFTDLSTLLASWG